MVGHPAFAGGPETHLFNYYLRPFLTEDPFLPWGGIHQWVETEHQRKMLRRFVDRVFAHRLAEEQKRRIVEKTPEHAHFIQHIKELYPEAKFIHIVRDGRDVMLSVFAYASNLPTPPETVEEAAGRWIGTLDTVEQMGRKYPDDILTVRYEDLVASPESNLSRIFAFIGEPCSPDKVKNIVEQYPPSAKSVGNWLRKLTAEDAVAFEKTAHDWLRVLNYELRLPESAPDGI
jgi:hypothetical protein